jgi:hypothetical protein
LIEHELATPTVEQRTAPDQYTAARRARACAEGSRNNRAATLTRAALALPNGSGAGE